MDAWRDDAAYLRGFDLFNAGRHWEAHEAWEDSWRAARGHDELRAECVQGLIQFAAALVKRGAGSEPAVRELGLRALGRLAAVRASHGTASYLGLDLDETMETMSRVLADPAAPAPRLVPRGSA